MAEFPDGYADFERFALEVVGRCLVEGVKTDWKTDLKGLASEVTEALLASRASIVPSSPPDTSP
ncbi:MAG: hypothetical protein ACYDBP_13335 [Leptospirales bacterium]